MLYRTITLSTITAALAAIPAVGGAQALAYGNAAPVSVTSCEASELYGPGLPFYEPSVEAVTGSLDVAFVNKSNIPAIIVKFERTDGQYKQQIVDKGTFSPGVTIKHSFQADGDTSAGDANCAVREVDFVDGSTWHAASKHVAGR